MVENGRVIGVLRLFIALPIALIIADYLKVPAELVLYASLVASGMPFMLLIGAAPNAIAYNPNQFTPVEFFKHGIVTSLMLISVVIIALTFYWPLLL